MLAKQVFGLLEHFKVSITELCKGFQCTIDFSPAKSLFEKKYILDISGLGKHEDSFILVTQRSVKWAGGWYIQQLSQNND